MNLAYSSIGLDWIALLQDSPCLARSELRALLPHQKFLEKCNISGEPTRQLAQRRVWSELLHIAASFSSKHAKRARYDRNRTELTTYFFCGFGPGVEGGGWLTQAGRCFRSICLLTRLHGNRLGRSIHNDHDFLTAAPI
jgi:hypothetical protein